jgi:hypothetical protein
MPDSPQNRGIRTTPRVMNHALPKGASTMQSKRIATMPVPLPWLVPLLGVVLGTTRAWGSDPPRPVTFAIQAGLAFPAGNDLKITTGSGLNPALGIQMNWSLNDGDDLRTRLDAFAFTQGRQEVQVPLIQTLETKIQAQALGEEYLFRPGGLQGRWTVGAGLYLVHWSVASTNSLSISGQGTVQGKGTSRWTREGLGLVASCRLTHRLDAEVRWLSSHYGYQNLPVYFGTAGLNWHF